MKQSIARLLLLSLFVAPFFFTACTPTKEGFQYPAPSGVIYNPMDVLPATSEYDDADIIPYVTELENYIADEDLPTVGKDVFYHFADLSGIGTGKVIGQCIVWANKNEVKVDSTWWAAASDYNRRSLVYHEMGHCVLGRGHRTYYYQGPLANYDNGIKPAWPLVSHYLADGTTLNPLYRGDWPISLMNVTLVKVGKIDVEFDYYLHELLHNNNLPIDNAGYAGSCEDDGEETTAENLEESPLEDHQNDS